MLPIINGINTYFMFFSVSRMCKTIQFTYALELCKTDDTLSSVFANYRVLFRFIQLRFCYIQTLLSLKK